jgi:P27 family predicted phage terminase small subunit
LSFIGEADSIVSILVDIGTQSLIVGSMGSRGKIPKAAFADYVKPAKGVGDAPSYITPEAQRYYGELSNLLTARLEPEDEHILAQCAQAMSEIARSNVQLSSNGYTYQGPQGEMPSPWMRIRALAHKEFQVASVKLGLSPADRHRMTGALAAQEQAGGPADFDKEHGSESA